VLTSEVEEDAGGSASMGMFEVPPRPNRFRVRREVLLVPMLMNLHEDYIGFMNFCQVVG
jgi:hypothetical protein